LCVFEKSTVNSFDKYEDISYSDRMKVTAIIADDLVNNVKTYSRSSTVTEAITIALKDWLDIYNIRELNRKISQNPIDIDNCQQIREMNRLV